MGKIVVSLPDDLEKALYDEAERRFGRAKQRARGISLLISEALKEFLAKGKAT